MIKIKNGFILLHPEASLDLSELKGRKFGRNLSFMKPNASVGASKTVPVRVRTITTLKSCLASTPFSSVISIVLPSSRQIGLCLSIQPKAHFGIYFSIQISKTHLQFEWLEQW